MSLNTTEQQRTAQELQQNFDLLGLSVYEVAADLGFTPERVVETLALRSGPVDAWLLRDYLCQAIADSGREALPFSVLNRANRLKAQLWFHLKKAPRHQWVTTPTAETTAR